jgi:hypothetical protein
MLKKLQNWTASEKGNTLLITDLDECCDFTAYIDLPGGGFLRVDYRAGDYPCLNICSIDMSMEEVAKQIQNEFVGWYVKKSSIIGLRTDENGYVVVPVRESYPECKCPDCAWKYVIGNSRSNCRHE